METEDKFYEKTLATTRTYTGKIVNVDVLDSFAMVDHVVSGLDSLVM